MTPINHSLIMVTTNNIFEAEADAIAIEVIEVDMVEVIAITRTSQVIRTSRMVNLTILREVFWEEVLGMVTAVALNGRGAHRGGNAGNSKNPLAPNFLYYWTSGGHAS